jgi:subtilisin family serine protease
MLVSSRLREACSTGSLLSGESQAAPISVALYAHDPKVASLVAFCKGQAGCRLVHRGQRIPFVLATLPRTLMSRWLEHPEAKAVIAAADLDDVYITLKSVRLSESREPANLKHKDPLQHEVFQPWTGKGVRVALLDTGMNPNRYIPENNVTHFDLVDAPGESTHRHDHATNISHLWVGTHELVPGLIPNCSVVDIRIMESSGKASVGTILQGCDKALEEQVDICSCSWGSSVPSDLINSAINAMEEAGVLVVCSAGNEGPASGEPGSSTILWPAKLPSVLTVGAVDGDGKLCTFSSTGDAENNSKPNLVELGEGILTAGTTSDGPWGPGLVASLVQGTSFACPRVVAVAAKLVEARKTGGYGWAPSFIREEIKTVCA